MRIYPQLLIWTYAILPALCVLLTPGLMFGIAKAQQMRAKALANAINIKNRAALARNQAKFGYKERPVFLRNPGRNARDAPDNQQEESIKVLQNFWNMKDFDQQVQQDTLRNDDEFRAARDAFLFDSKRIPEGPFFRDNVYDQIVGQENPLDNPQNEDYVVQPDLNDEDEIELSRISQNTNLETTRQSTPSDSPLGAERCEDDDQLFNSNPNLQNYYQHALNEMSDLNEKIAKNLGSNDDIYAASRTDFTPLEDRAANPHFAHHSFSHIHSFHDQGAYLPPPPPPQAFGPPPPPFRHPSTFDHLDQASAHSFAGGASAQAQAASQSFAGGASAQAASQSFNSGDQFGNERPQFFQVLGPSNFINGRTGFRNRRSKNGGEEAFQGLNLASQIVNSALKGQKSLQEQSKGEKEEMKGGELFEEITHVIEGGLRLKRAVNEKKKTKMIEPEPESFEHFSIPDWEEEWRQRALEADKKKKNEDKSSSEESSEEEKRFTTPKTLTTTFEVSTTEFNEEQPPSTTFLDMSTNNPYETSTYADEFTTYPEKTTTWETTTTDDTTDNSDIVGTSRDPLASIEAELNQLTEEEKKAFFRQEIDLISEIVAESLKEMSTESSTNKPEARNLFRDFHSFFPSVYHQRMDRSVAESFDAILGAHKEKVDDIQKGATGDDDLLMISQIGDGIIGDLETRKKNMEKSSSDNKETKTNNNRRKRNLDVPKTLDNVGTLVREAFESPKAPMYHVRNLLGNAKNTVISAAKIPPNNLLVPSQYQVVRIPQDERLGDINWAMLNSRSSIPEAPRQGLETTFYKIGDVVKGSVDSSKDMVLHASDMAKDAKNAVSTVRHGIVLPESSRINRVGDVLLAPRFGKLQEEHVAGDGQEQFVGIGRILDAVGVSNSNNQNVLDSSRNPSQVLQARELETLSDRPTSGTNLKDFLDKMHREMKEILTSQHEDRLRKLEEKKSKVKKTHDFVKTNNKNLLMPRSGFSNDKDISVMPMSFINHQDPKMIKNDDQTLGLYLVHPLPGISKQADGEETETLPPDILKLFTDDIPPIPTTWVEHSDDRLKEKVLFQKGYVLPGESKFKTPDSSKKVEAGNNIQQFNNQPLGSIQSTSTVSTSKQADSEEGEGATLPPDVLKLFTDDIPPIPTTWIEHSDDRLKEKVLLHKGYGLPGESKFIKPDSSKKFEVNNNMQQFNNQPLGSMRQSTDIFGIVPEDARASIPQGQLVGLYLLPAASRYLDVSRKDESESHRTSKSDRPLGLYLLPGAVSHHIVDTRRAEEISEPTLPLKVFSSEIRPMEMQHQSDTTPKARKPQDNDSEPTLSPDISKLFSDDFPPTDGPWFEHQDHRLKHTTTISRKVEKGEVTLRPVILKAPTDISPSSSHRDNVRSEDEKLGLYLPPELMRPFMGSPSDTTFQQFMRNYEDNIPAQKSAGDTLAAQSLQLENRTEESITNITTEIVTEPMLESVKKELETHADMNTISDGLSKENPEGVKGTGRTTLNISETFQKPFMGQVKGEKIQEFLNKYNGENIPLDNPIKDVVYGEQVESF